MNLAAPLMVLKAHGGFTTRRWLRSRDSELAFRLTSAGAAAVRIRAGGSSPASSAVRRFALSPGGLSAWLLRRGFIPASCRTRCPRTGCRVRRGDQQPADPLPADRLRPEGVSMCKARRLGNGQAISAAQSPIAGSCPNAPGTAAVKILVSCGDYYPHLGGVTSLFGDLARLLMKSGHSVTVLTRQWPGTAAVEEWNGCPICTARRDAIRGD